MQFLKLSYSCFFLFKSSFQTPSSDASTYGLPVNTRGSSALKNWGLGLFLVFFWTLQQKHRHTTGGRKPVFWEDVDQQTDPERSSWRQLCEQLSQRNDLQEEAPWRQSESVLGRVLLWVCHEAAAGEDTSHFTSTSLTTAATTAIPFD